MCFSICVLDTGLLMYTITLIVFISQNMYSSNLFPVSSKILTFFVKNSLSLKPKIVSSSLLIE